MQLVIHVKLVAFCVATINNFGFQIYLPFPILQHWACNYQTFLSGCCMAQRRSLSGRSPFCQRKQSDSRKFTGNFYPRINKLETKHEKTPTTCSLPESAGAVGCGLFLGRLDQGLVGNAESTHVNRPKGKATLVP